jgi:hypothetical protein
MSERAGRLLPLLVVVAGIAGIWLGATIFNALS